MIDDVRFGELTSRNQPQRYLIDNYGGCCKALINQYPHRLCRKIQLVIQALCGQGLKASDPGILNRHQKCCHLASVGLANGLLDYCKLGISIKFMSRKSKVLICCDRLVFALYI